MEGFKEVKQVVKMDDEFAVRDMLREQRRKIDTFEDLVSYLEFIKNNCNTDYGTAPRSIAQASAAVAWYFADEFGITGFQAGFVMWDFIIDWNYRSNKCGLKIVDYDSMLYPQYAYRFEKVISGETWAALQEQARKNLEEVDQEHHSPHPAVIAHWQSIVDGQVPFGYKIESE